MCVHLHACETGQADYTLRTCHHWPAPPELKPRLNSACKTSAGVCGGQAGHLSSPLIRQDISQRRAAILGTLLRTDEHGQQQPLLGRTAKVVTAAAARAAGAAAAAADVAAAASSGSRRLVVGVGGCAGHHPPAGLHRGTLWQEGPHIAPISPCCAPSDGLELRREHHLCCGLVPVRIEQQQPLAPRPHARDQCKIAARPVRVINLQEEAPTFAEGQSD